jgi:hypothetical protein
LLAVVVFLASFLTFTFLAHDGLEFSIVPGGLEGEHDQMENQEGESDKDETEHLTTSEGGDEAQMGASAALVGGSCVGEHGNGHADVTCKDGGA